jgi:DNA mismatch repair protein MutL
MPVIRQLPASVVNKIAAGEVIERPASVIKELMENSIDAGARNIEVEITGGGMEMMRITDDGHGIEGSQLLLAVTSHATSKIENADQLFRVSTLGFRGEALASIAEVSQMTVRSRTADSDSGYELRVNGGVHEEVVPCSCAIGTTIEVGNLFFNTPVRRKFLRSPQTEMGHIGEAFARIALAWPSVGMRLLHNGRPIHELAATDNPSRRIRELFGSDIGQALIPVSCEEGQIRISGHVVDPSQSRGHNRMQYLILNGRHIRDRSLQHALGEAYRGLLLSGRFPIAFLRMEMPHELVDVNVHPAKLEVRFVDGSRLYSLLLGSIRNRFLSMDLTAREQLARGGSELPHAPSIGSSVSGSGQTAPMPVQSTIPLEVERNYRDWTSAVPEFRPFPGSGPAMPSRFSASPAADVTASREWNAPGSSTALRQDPGHGSLPVRPQAVPLPSRALQIHNRYLVTESDEGVVVIDQHALHERIIYEQLREKVLGGKLETQQLLVPEPVPLSPGEAARCLESQAALAEIGIVVEEFGRDTVLVSAYPAMLANLNPAELLRSVVDLLIDESRKPGTRDILDELLHMISCKAAIKAGDRLTDDEIMALLEHRELCQDAHHCPHGRPTSLVFSREELDRRFKRI